MNSSPEPAPDRDTATRRPRSALRALLDLVDLHVIAL
ncbi:hypothetical protein FHS34_001061 [Streptomyces echinatus]|uniref:Uncharacterized protein n=1 Tax=Streptomyces echinatus TaxID=67293 RepID=A0A7W9UNT2_9ACTN|nr:hypothetical protein [Streptomyces echinatus]